MVISIEAMVIVNDFEFQIISAEDKTPFKEHKKGGNTFVEVEPDAEYYLSVRKVRKSSTKLVCSCKVDGKSLGHRMNFRASKKGVLHSGIYSRSKGVKQKEALKFVKASFTSGDMAVGSTMAGMGSVELDVYTAIYAGKKTRQDYESSFKASTIKMVDDAVVTMKKNLRSGKGSNIDATPYDMNELYKFYTKGDHLYTIKLHYCATPGLMAVGVLPKPPAWEWLRMNKPAETTAEEKEKLNKLVVSVKHNRKGNEILELADGDVQPDSAEPKHKKIRTLVQELVGIMNDD